MQQLIFMKISEEPGIFGFRATKSSEEEERVKEDDFIVPAHAGRISASSGAPIARNHLNTRRGSTHCSVVNTFIQKLRKCCRAGNIKRHTTKSSFYLQYAYNKAVGCHEYFAFLLWCLEPCFLFVVITLLH
jgi:hypothetical protein